jgi:hypothetical protein
VVLVWGRAAWLEAATVRDTAALEAAASAAVARMEGGP